MGSCLETIQKYFYVVNELAFRWAHSKIYPVENLHLYMDIIKK